MTDTPLNFPQLDQLFADFKREAEQFDEAFRAQMRRRDERIQAVLEEIKAGLRDLSGGYCD